MNNIKSKKKALFALYSICPAAHWSILSALLVVLLHLVTRQVKALMAWLSEGVVRPVHAFMASLCANFSFSVAEVLIGAAASVVLCVLLRGLWRLMRRKASWKGLYRSCMGLLAFGLWVYADFCLLWGVYYYGDDFAEKSGFENGPVSTEQLETVTAYFAGLANEYARQVPRNDDGFYQTDRAALIAKSPEVFRKLTEEYPFLSGPEVAVKPVRFSRLMSYTDFTGFFFPFTAEANVNTDFPPGTFAATIAHELSHQRGVSKEQEANFTAVLACMSYGDREYCYSASLLAYTYLGNALRSADYEAWERVYESLSENVLRDLALGRAYWRQFETPVQTVSNAVYENFLYSYGQELGLKSYGACVDMLVNYYWEQAEAWAQTN